MNLELKTHFKLLEKVNYTFIYIIFALPFISFPFIQNSTKIGQEIYLILVTALWLLVASLLVLKKKEIVLFKIDILFICFLFYICINFYFLSYFEFLSNQFLIFIGYIVLFFLFKTCIENTKEMSFFNATVYIIYSTSLIQSALAIMQRFNLIKSENDFFTVTGTYINPNFLGVAVLFGLISSIYILKFLVTKKSMKFFVSATLLIMVYVLILTECRAAWITFGIILICIAVNKHHFFSINNQKKMMMKIFISLVGVFLIFHYLYMLNPDSVNGRTFIQKISFAKILEAPFLGSGLLNFKPVYNNAKAEYFLETQRHWNEIKVADYVTVAFNDYTQTVFEIGFIGLVLIALILFYLIIKIEPNRATVIAAAFILSCLLLALFTSVLYNPNAMIYLIWALAVLASNNKIEPIAVIKNKITVYGLSMFLIITSLCGLYISCKKVDALAKFKLVSEDQSQKIYYKLDDHDLYFIQDNPYVEFRIGLEKFQENKTKGISIMENSLRKDPNPKANVALSTLYFQQKKYKKAESLLKLNIGLEPSRFEPLANLLFFYKKTNNNLKTTETAEKIINLPVKIKSKKVLEFKNLAKEILQNKKSD